MNRNYLVSFFKKINKSYFKQMPVALSVGKRQITVSVGTNLNLSEQ